jgi:hypothetical protein
LKLIVELDTKSETMPLDVNEREIKKNVDESLAKHQRD